MLDQRISQVSHSHRPSSRVLIMGRRHTEASHRYQRTLGIPLHRPHRAQGQHPDDHVSPTPGSRRDSVRAHVGTTRGNDLRPEAAFEDDARSSQKAFHRGAFERTLSSCLRVSLLKECATQPERPKIDYYSPPPLFPYVLPLIAAESLLAFAVFGWGSLADRFRGLIQHYGGPYMLSVAQGFFALMVRTWRTIRLSLHR